MIGFNPVVPPGHVRRDGIVKVKLAHGQGFSLLLVDRVYVEKAGSWTFYEPAMFGPPEPTMAGAPRCHEVKKPVGQSRTSS